jgi:hypothetical protein
MAENSSEPLQPAETSRKSFVDMDLGEVLALAQRAVTQAVEEMHQQGVPSVFRKDGKRYIQYPDGRIEEITSSSPVAEKE